MTPLKIPIACFGLLLQTTLAHSQAVPTPVAPAPAAAPSPPSTTEINTVTVQGQRNADSNNGITRTIGQTELTKDGADNVLDVLKRQPGITVTNGQISLRGIGSAYVRVLVDGQRPPPGFTIDQLSPQMVERIEIIPGGGVEANAQSMGGTINIILKRTRSGQQGNLNVGAEGGRYGDVVRGTATYGNSSGALAWFLSSNFRLWTNERPTDVDTRSVQEGETVFRSLATGSRDTKGQSASFSPRLTYTPNKNTRVQAQIGTWFWSNKTDSVRDTQLLLGQAPTYISTTSVFDGGGNGFWFGGELDQGITDSGKLELRLNGGRWRFNGKDTRNVFISGVPSVELEDNRNNGSWQGVKLIWRQNLSDKQNMSFGVEHEGSDAKINRLNTVNAQDVLNPAKASASQRVRQMAGFLRHEYDTGASLASDAGFRYEQIQYSLFDLTNRTEAPLQRLLAPSLQLQYKPNGSKTQAYRFELARKWRLINVQELRLTDILALDNRFDNPDRLGNVFLKPEKSWNLDVAYTRKIGSEGSASITLTAKRLDDLIKNVTRFEAGRWTIRADNIGSGEIRGIEFDTKGRLSDYVDSWAKTQVRASIGFYQSELKSIAGPGNRVASQLPLVFNIGFDHRFADSAFSVGSSFKYSQRGLEKITERESITTQDDRNLTVYGQWSLTPKMNLRIAADDLFTGKSDSTARYIGLTNETIVNTIVQTGPKFRVNLDVRL